MKSILQTNSIATTPVLYMALELSHKNWKIGFSNGAKHRIVNITARDMPALMEQIRLAKEKLLLERDCPICSCYEAGRDGFWIHRYLLKEKIENHVIDSASIETSRRKKQVKTDKVDVKALLRLLMRFKSGEKEALRSIRVPSVEEEDLRRLHRERDRLIKERGSHSARMKSLLVSHGIVISRLSELPEILAGKKITLGGYELPIDLKSELKREYERYKLVCEQIKELESLQIKRSKDDKKGMDNVNQMMLLKGVGWQSSWILGMEFFNWREFRNAKQVGSCAGLTPTPYDSGDSTKEQGISKAGNKRIRKTMIELAWLWLRYQPQSDISKWFESRFASGGKRMRRIGIVAMARKLLVALWRYLEHGEIPGGTVLTA